MSFANILRDLLEEHNLSQARLAAAIGFSQRAVSKWINNQAEPTETAITACAAYFGVTVDEILGISDYVSKPHTTPASAALPLDEKELLTIYRKLPYEGKQRLIARAEVMLEDTEQKNKHGA